MKALSLVIIVLASLRGARTFHPYIIYVPTAGANVGDPCTPSTPSTCGEKELLAETSEQPTSGSFGPNVCNFSKIFQVATNTHSFQRRCSFWSGRCRLKCVSDNNCSGPMINFTKSRIDCCDGFATAQSDPISVWHRYYHRHNKKFILRNEGCTVVLMPTVVDCLNELNATIFESFISSAPELLEILISENSRVTVFAPTDEAFEELDATVLAELFGSGAAEVILSAHVANSTVPSAKLVRGRVLRTLAENRFLHVTEVDIYRRGHRGYIKHKAERRIFVNGAEVVVKDACQARNGIVHVVDSVIPSSNQTIAEQLGEDSQFSIFKDLLDASGISVFLNQSKPRTVFAPTNEAFNQLPDGAVECLLRESNKRQLKALVLVHISYPAEYTSSLRLRKYIPTFLGPLVRVQDINGTVHITRDEIPLEEGADRPARNGVFHAIGEVIVPDCIDFESMCPDPPATPTIPVPEGSGIPAPVPEDPGVPEVPEGTGPSVIPTLSATVPGDLEPEGGTQPGIPVAEGGR